MASARAPRSQGRSPSGRAASYGPVADSHGHDPRRIGNPDALDFTAREASHPSPSEPGRPRPPGVVVNTRPAARRSAVGKALALAGPTRRARTARAPTRKYAYGSPGSMRDEPGDMCVVDDGLHARRPAVLEVGLDTRMPVERVQHDAVGVAVDRSAEDTFRGRAHLPVEDDLPVVRAAQIEVVGGEGFEERTGMPWGGEGDGLGDLDLAHRDIPPVAGIAVGAGTSRSTSSSLFCITNYSSRRNPSTLRRLFTWRYGACIRGKPGSLRRR
jgi:hypothetical protein